VLYHNSPAISFMIFSVSVISQYTFHYDVNEKVLKQSSRVADADPGAP